jgi:carbonic anhydrase
MKLSRLVLILSVFAFVNACSLFSHKEETKPTESTPAAAPLKTEDDGAAEAQTPASTEEVVWSYEGETGPEHWGDLKPEFIQCKEGKEQSPVDLIYKKPLSDRPLEIHYQPTAATIVDTGHTIQVNFAAGNVLQVDGKTYTLTNAVFHTASEHTISGNRLPLEIQLNHQADDGSMAVLAVIMIDGSSHPVIEALWQNMPIQKETEKELNFKIDPSDLIPKTRTYYHYMGSLTTPPCTEGVSWNVFNTPLTLSAEQIKSFRALYPSNNRPAQPLNGRTTTNYR